MIKAIPKRKLPHTAIYNAYLGNTGEGDTWEETDITIKFCKIEERQQFIYNNNGREIIGNATMFYDYVNSTGLTDKPINNSKITFNNHEYRIVDTEVLYADSTTPHHYEILLK